MRSSRPDTQCRWCSKCRQARPPSEFSPSDKSYCRSCKSDYNREHPRKRSGTTEAPENEMTDAHAPSTDVDELYVMRNARLPGELKIGRSKDARERKHELQRSQNFSIEVLAVFPQMGHLERAVHAKLQHFRVSGVPGTEWFACDLDEAVAAVMAVRRADELGNALSSFAFPG